MVDIIPVRAINAPTQFKTWDEVKNIDVDILGNQPVKARLWHDGVNPVGYSSYSLTIFSNTTMEEALAKEWLGKALLKQIDDAKPFVIIKGISVMTSVFQGDIGLFATNVEIEYKIGN